MEDMKDIEARGENVLLLGDLNRAIGAGQCSVEGNEPNISYGGQPLRDLLASEKYVLLNGLSLAEGGPWTWVDGSNSSVKSCLDLGIVSAGMVPFVTTFLVDKEQDFTPMRVRRTKKGVTSTYSDHFSLELSSLGSQGLEDWRRRKKKKSAPGT